ncbi:MAG: histidinol-phosphate transaminase [Gammaproteobacteria bacterium]|nr:histidinol-phosphate transaminase [Gammaproteobacteria bacterium]
MTDQSATDFDALRLATPGVAGLSPYQPGKPTSELERELGLSDTIKLASNENPLGPPPAALAAIREVLPELALYPDGNGFALKQALGEHLGVAPSMITLGNGSNDILVLLAEAFLLPGLEAVYSQYAFAVYELATRATGATACVAPALPAGDDAPLGHDLAAMASLVSPRTRLVFIANPNNPTGTALPLPALRQFIEQLPEHVVVVVDEAYVEYAQDPAQASVLAWLDEFPNLVVSRTFSKGFGLAGLRIGYAVSSAQIADVLNRIRQPFNVGHAAQAAAVAALGDHEYLQRSRQVNREGLRQLAGTLDALGLWYGADAGNFLLVDMGRPAAEVYTQLLKQGVIVRPLANYGLPHHLRISIGTHAQLERLDQALRQVQHA